MKAYFIYFIICSTITFFFFGTPLHANETAAGIAASGIYFKEEKNISIEKEVLYISLDRVEVSYLFKNHSTKDITTLIAFPVPDYGYDETEAGDQISWRDFHDFTVNVNDSRQEFQTEARALLYGKDYTSLLKDMNLPIKDFGEDGDRSKGCFQDDSECFFDVLFQKLSDKDRKQLLDIGLVSKFRPHVPFWTVSLKYYWRQSFPAQNFTSIKHTYTPKKWFDTFKEGYYTDACIPEELDRWIKDTAGNIKVKTVKYILQTANNWKKPIKEFHLIIEAPRTNGTKLEGSQEPWFISTCFDEDNNRLSYSRYESIIEDFVPKNDINVFFFSR